MKVSGSVSDHIDSGLPSEVLNDQSAVAMVDLSDDLEM